ncbi:hypothetical protein Tco_1514288, partial [Tanacetum coccineum]
MASRVNRDTVSIIKGRVPLHLSSSAGGSNGTHHCCEKGSDAEKLAVELHALNGLCGLMGGLKPLSVPRLASKGGKLGESRVVCIPQMIRGLVRSRIVLVGVFHCLSHWAQSLMVSHASSALNTL